MKIPHKFRAMKGERLTDLSLLKNYPYLATPKFDGIRAFTFEMDQQLDLYGHRADLVSLTLTAIPNKHIQETITSLKIYGLDGELVTYTNGKMDGYNDVQSKVMSVSGKPDFKYHVFDRVNTETAFSRARSLANFNSQHAVPVTTFLVSSENQLIEYENKCLLEGYEGVMLRSTKGIYKLGRSTVKQGHLIKMKRFLDSEATVIGFTELEHNNNEATTDARGLTERSDHKSNKVGGSTLGALVCSGHNGQTFNIGTGFTQEQRQNIWNQRDNFKFATVKYKYQPHGMKDAPRSPVFLGFRQPGDIES